MKASHVMGAAIGLYLLAAVSWWILTLMQWPLVIAMVTTLPLVAMVVVLCQGRPKIYPKVYVYAALLLMPYLAIAMSQIVIATQRSPVAVICLAASLLYLMFLPMTLRAIKQVNTKLDRTTDQSEYFTR